MNINDPVSDLRLTLQTFKVEYICCFFIYLKTARGTKKVIQLVSFNFSDVLISNGNSDVPRKMILLRRLYQLFRQ